MLGVRRVRDGIAMGPGSLGEEIHREEWGKRVRGISTRIRHEASNSRYEVT